MEAFFKYVFNVKFISKLKEKKGWREMNKTDLITYMSENVKGGGTKADAERFLNAALDGIIAGLRDDEKVTLTGFGTYKTSPMKAREGQNPKTGEKIMIEASTRVNFSAGKKTKDVVNGKDDLKSKKKSKKSKKEASKKVEKTVTKKKKKK